MFEYEIPLIIKSGEIKQLVSEALTLPELSGDIGLPRNGYRKLYPKGDGLYVLDSLGNEIKLGYKFTDEAAYKNIAQFDTFTVSDAQSILEVYEKSLGNYDNDTKLLLRGNNGTIEDVATYKKIRKVGQVFSPSSNADTTVNDVASNSGFSSGIVFNGKADALKIIDNPTDFGYGIEDFTIDFWVNFRKLTGGQILIDHRDGLNGFGPVIFVNDAALMYFSDGIRMTSNTSLIINKWYHIALVKDTNVTTLYINGNVVGFFTDNLNYGTENFLTIGAYLDGSDFDGYMSELRISKGVARWPAGLEFIPNTNPYIKTIPGDDWLSLTEGMDWKLDTTRTDLRDIGRTIKRLKGGSADMGSIYI